MTPAEEMDEPVTRSGLVFSGDLLSPGIPVPPLQAARLTRVHAKLPIYLMASLSGHVFIGHLIFEYNGAPLTVAHCL